MKILCINTLDNPRIESIKIKVVCLDKYSNYLIYINDILINKHNIFDILDIIKNKILQLRHDDKINIKIDSELYWEESEMNINEIQNNI